MSPKRALANLRMVCHLGLTREALGTALLQALRDVVPNLHGRFVWCDAQRRPTAMYCEAPEMYELGRLFFDRYDNRMHDFPGTAFALSRPAGVGHYLPMVTRADYFRSAYYNEIERPAGGHHFVDVVFADGVGTLGMAILTRERRVRPFSAHEIALLSWLVPHAARGLRHAEIANRDVAAGPGETELLVADADGRLLAASVRARQWLAMALCVDAAQGSIEAHWFDRLPTALVQSCKAITSAGRDTLDTRRPTTIRNGWGAFRIEARCLSRVGDASTTQVAICIRHFEPLELGVMRNLRRLGLTPTQTTLCVHLVRGRSTQAQLAVMLGVNATTIHDHLRKVYGRLGVHSRDELIAALKAC